MKMKNDFKPVILIDSREQLPLQFQNLKSEIQGLYSGDYSIKHFETCFAVERKSVADLIGSLTSGRDRFEHECHRLRGHSFKRILVVGTMDELREQLQRRKATFQSIQGSLSAIEVRYNLPVVWVSKPENAAIMIERWAWYFYREALKPFKRLNTPEEIIKAVAS